MDMGQVQAAVGINIDIFRSVIKLRFENGSIPTQFEIPTGSGPVPAHINELVLEVRDEVANPHLGFHITGEFALAAAPPTPFNCWIQLQAFARPQDNAAAVGALATKQVDDAD